MMLDFLYVHDKIIIMKKLMSYYYEFTIIPAIILGSLSNLGWYFVHLVTYGFIYITTSEMVTSYVVFLIVMTIADIINGLIFLIRNR